MNKAQLVEKLALKSKLTKSEAEAHLDTLIDVIQNALIKGDEVKLVGFGTFTRTKRKARVGRNPQTGKEVKIEAAYVAKFRPGKDLKEALNK